jgi:riboflavin synthase
MFTGIVEECGEVESFSRAGGAWKLKVSARGITDGVPGESVAVNGCCLTAVGFDGSAIEFDVLEETRRLTNLASIVPGAPVNLERSLRADSRLGGHFVTGHIDGRGTIEVFEARGADHYLRIRGPESCGRLLVMKGSVAVDGISLTVAEVDGDSFAVWIIPHTLAVTNLRIRGAGDTVNLEFDMLGKYVEKLLQSQKHPTARECASP